MNSACSKYSIIAMCSIPNTDILYDTDIRVRLRTFCFSFPISLLLYPFFLVLNIHYIFRRCMEWQNRLAEKKFIVFIAHLHSAAAAAAM